MKTLFTITLFFSMLFCSSLLSQDLRGIATYKTQRKMDVQLDSTKMDDGMRTQIMAMLKKQFEKEYELEFTSTESIYKEVVSLEKPRAANDGMQIVVASTDGSDILYKNLKENRFVSQNELFSKQFLVLDSIKQPNWELHKDTKNIGEYTCFKATYKRMVTVTNSMMSSGNENDSEASEEKEEEQLITAWYTPQIPLKNGPARYNGLPGLILEVSDGSETILCSKIVLNPKEGISISEPSKGKKVSQAEFEAIMDKKMKEQAELFENNRGNHDGNSIEIKIGG